MSPNLIMIDSAPNDPRSASAMLRGSGDGREQVWLDFEKAHAEIEDQEALMGFFSHEVRYGRVGYGKENKSSQRKFWWFVVVTLFILS